LSIGSDQIEIDGVVFRFKGDAVVGVSFIDEDSPEGRASHPE
jgi:hypothetical protein